jgi:1-acyl-sn-glycerol-3-phosphate acyltransferase
MLDLHRLNRIVLSPAPLFQRFVATTLLTPNYKTPPGVRIEFEGFENVPRGENVIYAMNHTDRYNYWPLQYAQWRRHGRFTATWVKGKYYEHPLMGLFMEWTNNIPTVSRGYIIARDFVSTLERAPSKDEYTALRTWVDGGDAPERGQVPDGILTRPRDVLGRSFAPARESYPDAIRGTFGAMMARFTELNVEAKDKGLDLLIFPQGTRSIRLSRGHLGLAQMALKLRWTIVPVGCNGSDKCYPGSSPWALPGKIVYRFGEPIRYADMAAWHIDEDYAPFTLEAEAKHGDAFRGLIDVVMDRINDLLDPQYQHAENLDSDGVQGTNRFL